MSIVVIVLVVLVLLLIAFVVSARLRPTPFPYSQRALLIPLPFLDVDRLHSALEPPSAARLLDLGAGTGRHALRLAERIAPEGSLVAVDVQQEMLDDLASRAGEREIENLSTVRADARELPFEDGSFDGAYLVTVLGEIPDQEAALRELRRVVKSGGAVVVGESPFDPHFIRASTLRRRASAAGLEEDRRLGPAALGYYARFRVP